MKNRIVFSSLFILLCSIAYTQVSFGIKAGKAISLFSTFEYSKERFHEERNNYVLSNHIRSRLDSIANAYPRSSSNRKFMNLANLEYGAYLSVPSGLKSRIRIEVAMHSQRLTDGEFKIPMVGQTPVLKYFYLAEEKQQQFIRPSIHWHSYFSKNTAFNFGLSYSIVMNENVDLSGCLVTIESPSQTITTLKTDEYKIYPQDMFGLNMGFLTKIGGLPKIEVRGACYFLNTRITGLLNIPSETTLTYGNYKRFTGIKNTNITFSLFVEI